MNKQDILNAFREKFTSNDPKNVDEAGVPFLYYWKTQEVSDWLLNTLTEFERETLKDLLKEYERVQKDIDDEYKSREDYQPNYLGILKGKIEELEKEKHT